MNIDTQELATFYIGNHQFGIDKSKIHALLEQYAICPVPFSEPNVLGLIYHQDAILCAINMATILKLSKGNHQQQANIVVQAPTGLVSLVVEKLGDSLTLNSDLYQSIPTHLDDHLKSLLSGVYQLDDSLLLVINLDKF